MGRLRATSIILALLLAALALGACGGGSDAKLLPGTTASEINQNLEAVRQRVGEGDCEGAEEAAAAVSTQVDELGDGVDKKLRAALGEGAERLGEVVETCGESEDEEEQAEAEAQEDLEEAEGEEEQANVEAEEKAQAKDEKAQEKEEKAQGREEEQQETEEEKEATPPGKGKGPEGQEEGAIEPVEPPEAPSKEAESGGIGPGGVAE
jgi:hypothetical protein